VRDWSITSPLRTSRGDRWYVQGNGYVLPKLMRQTLGGEVEPRFATSSRQRGCGVSRRELLLSQPEICSN